MTIESEQWSDLHWATDVMVGKGDESDIEAVAVGMLQTLIKHGANQQIKHAAWLTLDGAVRGVM